MASSRMLVLQKQEWFAVLGKSAHSHIVRLTHSRRNGPKSDNDKSSVALLKKGDWHERGSVTDRYHDRSGKPDKRSDKKLGTKFIETSVI